MQRPAILLILATTVALLVAGVLVRGLEPAPLDPLAGTLEGEGTPIVEPLQFLQPSARTRIDELTAYVVLEHRIEWEAAFREVFEIEGCPDARTWLDGARGQAFGRLVGTLRRGSREEAFAALALLFELARNTRWKAGVVYGDSSNAQRVAELLESWLATWAERAARDPLLYEPAVACVLVYGRVMRAAWNAPAFGKNEAARTRATRFLEQLTGARERTRTAFGDALQARYPRAYALLLRDDDSLEGLASEAAAFYPDLDGVCGR